MTSTDSHSASNATERQPRLFTVNEVSELLRVPVATLRYWRHIGDGAPSFRVGRYVRYRDTEVFEWLDHQHDNDGPHTA